MARDGPILVVRGTDARRVALVRVAGGLGFALVAAGTFAAGTLIFRSKVPWAQLGGSWFPLLIPGALGAYLGERLMRPSTGSVAFYPGRIVISKRTRRGLLKMGPEVEHTEQVLWSELTGFDDGRSDHIRLVVERGQNSFLTVPTVREEDRVAVLRLLDQHGVRRLE